MPALRHDSHHSLGIGQPDRGDERPRLVERLLDDLGLSREAHLVICNGTLVPGDARLEDGDTIEIDIPPNEIRVDSFSVWCGNLSLIRMRSSSAWRML